MNKNKEKLDEIYSTSKDSDIFEWDCDEVYQNNGEELNIVINSIPKVN